MDQIDSGKMQSFQSYLRFCYMAVTDDGRFVSNFQSHRGYIIIYECDAWIINSFSGKGSQLHGRKLITIYYHDHQWFVSKEQGVTDRTISEIVNEARIRKSLGKLQSKVDSIHESGDNKEINKLVIPPLTSTKMDVGADGLPVLKEKEEALIKDGLTGSGSNATSDLPDDLPTSTNVGDRPTGSVISNGLSSLADPMKDGSTEPLSESIAVTSDEGPASSIQPSQFVVDGDPSTLGSGLALGNGDGHRSSRMPESSTGDTLNESLESAGGGHGDGLSTGVCKTSSTITPRSTIHATWSDVALNKPGHALEEAISRGVVKRGFALDNYRRGIKGEEMTASMIDSLDLDVLLLNGVSITRSMDIDHVLITDRGIFVINSKNINGGIRLVDDEIYCGSSSRPTENSWVQTLDNNVLIVRGKLVEAGYPTSIPIIPLIVVWGGPVSSTGSHSGSFVEGSHLDEWLIRYYDASEIELDKSLFRWIKADMRKSTFWLK